MRRIIKEKEIRNIVKSYIAEALKYDKERKQYFPDYTGNRHSDAGKYAANGKDYEYNYARNRYQWSNKDNQDRFERLQFRGDFEPDETDPDRENENGASDYLEAHEADTIIKNAIEDLTPSFNNMLDSFINNAAQKYPIFRDRYHMSDLVYALKDLVDEYDY